MSRSAAECARRWRERGNSIIFISHRMAEVAALCDRATVLRDGVTVGVTDIVEGSEDRIVSLMLGVEPAKAHPSEATRGRLSSDASEDPALSVHDLNHGHILKNVSFALRPGEILGVAALEGQGQQELFDCIAGVSRHDGGDIVAHGRKLRLNHPGDAIAAGLVLVPANRLQALLPQRSIRENVALPLVRNPRNWGLIRVASERERVGAAVLHARLAAVDPAAAAAILPGNGRRIVRALEVIELSGQPFSATLPGYESVYRVIQLGVAMPAAMVASLTPKRSMSACGRYTRPLAKSTRTSCQKLASCSAEHVASERRKFSSFTSPQA